MTSYMSSPTVASLKAEGVELFKQRKYKEAAKKFTLAIEHDEPGSNELKAQCHNNRAASKENAGGATRPALIADMNEAIRLKPDYGKAYARRQRYYRESGQWREALADLYAANHLGVGETEDIKDKTDYMQRLGMMRMDAWRNKILAGGGDCVVKVPHAKVCRLMNAFVRDDGLLKDVHAYMNGGMREEGVYSEVLKMFTEKQYDDIDEFIEERKNALGERAIECWLFAALILALKGRHKESRALALSASNQVLDLLFGNRKYVLMNSLFTITYESATSDEDLMNTWRVARAALPLSADVYVQAFSLLSDHDKHASALTVINDRRGFRFHPTITLLRGIAPLFTHPPNALSLSRALVNKALFRMGRAADARALAKLLAERDDAGWLWHAYSLYVDAGDGEKERALLRCVAVDPFHVRANEMLAAFRMKHFAAVAHFKVSMHETRLALQYSERCVSGFDLSTEPTRLVTNFSLHEAFKAQLRAAEMLGVE